MPSKLDFWFNHPDAAEIWTDQLMLKITHDDQKSDAELVKALPNSASDKSEFMFSYHEVRAQTPSKTWRFINWAISKTDLFGTGECVAKVSLRPPNYRKIDYRMMKMKFLLKMLNVMCAIVLGTMAQAGEDGKYYPGAVCQYWSGSSNIPREDFGVSQFGWVGNQASSGTLHVVCPLLRERSEDDITRVVVNVFDPSCPEASEGDSCAPTVGCRLNVSNAWGRQSVSRVLNFGRVDEANNTGLNVFEAHVRGGTTNVGVPNATASGGFFTYVLYCTIPPGQRITGILLAEDT